MRRFIGLALISGAAHAGAVYDLNTRSMAEPSAAPVVAHYVVSNDRVRVTDADGKLAFIFRDQTIYVVDSSSRTVSAEKYATLQQVAAKAARTGRSLQEAATSAPPDQQAALQEAARQMKGPVPVARDYQPTDRYESVAGHRCRLWEERESGLKRLELCVAPVQSVSAGVDVLHGMQTLSQYFGGSRFALGVDYGSGPWWSGIETLGGLPLLIREFKDGSEIAETTLTAIRGNAPAASPFELPAGYPVEEQPLGDP